MEWRDGRRKIVQFSLNAEPSVGGVQSGRSPRPGVYSVSGPVPKPSRRSSFVCSGEKARGSLLEPISVGFQDVQGRLDPVVLRAEKNFPENAQGRHGTPRSVKSPHSCSDFHTPPQNGCKSKLSDFTKIHRQRRRHVLAC